MSTYQAEDLATFLKEADEDVWEAVADGAPIRLPDGSVWARVAPGGADCDLRYYTLIDRHEKVTGTDDRGEALSDIHDIFVNVARFQPDRLYCSACGWFHGQPMLSSTR